MQSNKLSLVEKIAKCDFQFNETFDVIITKLHHPGMIFVRPVIVKQEDFNYLEIPGQVMSEADIVKDKIVVYFSETVKKYVRGKISNIVQRGGKTCVIHAMDYGHFDIYTPVSKIHQPSCNETVKPLATRCMLANCFPIGNSSWSLDTVKTMENFIGGPVVKLYVRGVLDDDIWVDLYTTRNNINIGKWMVEQKLASPNINGTVDDEPQKLCKRKQYTTIDLEDGDILEVRVQYVKSRNEFYVAKIQDYEKYLKDRVEFTKVCDELEELSPDEILVNRMVGYKCPYEGEYYERAYITKIKQGGNKAIIQLLDWGETIEVFCNELKNVDYKTIFENPAIALYCSTEKKKDGTEHNLYTGLECIITVDSAGDDFYIKSDVTVQYKTQ